MPRNPWVRIAIIVVLAIVLYILVVNFARDAASADASPVSAGSSSAPLRAHPGTG